MNGRRATYVFILCAVSCIIALPLDIPEDTIALKTDNSSVGESSKQDNVTSTEDITEMISPSRNNSEEIDEEIDEEIEIDEENNEETSVGTSEKTGEETETGEENSEETGSEGTSEEETEETSEKINEEDKTTKSPKKAEECYTSKEVYIYIDIT